MITILFDSPSQDLSVFSFGHGQIWRVDCKKERVFDVEFKIFRAPPWARLLQEEWEVETRRRLDERRRGIYRMATQVLTSKLII